MAERLNVRRYHFYCFTFNHASHVSVGFDTFQHIENILRSVAEEEGGDYDGQDDCHLQFLVLFTGNCLLSGAAFGRSDAQLECF